MTQEYTEANKTQHDVDVQAAIKSYEDEFKMAMELGAEDFQGNASKDA